MKRFFMIFMFICTMFAGPAYAETETETIVAEQPTLTANDEMIRYSTVNLNVRTEPSLNGQIIHTLKRNDTVTKIQDVDDTWTNVIWHNENNEPINCYVASRYLSEEESVAPLVSDNDRYWLAHAIHGEMQGTPWEDHLYTGSVILNRVKSQHYPNTIESVITDRKWGIQYACYWDGNFQKTPSQMAWNAADYLLTNGSIFPDNVLFQAQFKQGNGVYLHTNAAYYCIW